MRLLDPEQRPEAEEVLRRELGRVTLEADPAALTATCADADRGALAVAELAASGVRVADFSLGQPSLDEVFLALTGHTAQRQRRRGRRARGGRHEHDHREVVHRRRDPQGAGSTPRPSPAGPFASAMAFAWRGMLKVKHVPEQLLDVTITPVMFLLMFTYIFGGAISGSTQEYLQYILPGTLVMSVLFTTVYSGVALNTDLTRGVVDRIRTLPIWRPSPLVGALLGTASATSSPAR